MTATISESFHTLIMQPTSLCNLDCGYCYLPDRKQHRVMSVNVAAAVVASITQQNGAWPVEVVWHGGEPTATPIFHMRRLLAEFEDLRKSGKSVHCIQTNATLLTPEWCDLLARYQFHVGVSVDGPSTQNMHRVDWSGKQSFDRVIRGVGLLKQAGLPFNVICVVTPETIAHAEMLARFFEELGCESVGFNLEEREGMNSNRPPLTSEQAEGFWRRLWEVRESGLSLPIRDLDRLVDWLDLTRSGRRTQPAPVDPIPTVSTAGDVVVLSPELLGIRDPRYNNFVIGNVLSESMSAMLARSHDTDYVREFAAGLESCARECDFFDFCRGAQAGNRYFEHGTFRATETAYCRNTRQALVRAATAHLNEGR